MMPRDSDSDDDVPLSQRVVEREAEEEDPDAESQDLDYENWSGPGHEAWVQAHPQQALFVNPDALLRQRRERQASPAAPAQATPVQEAARVANPRVQRVVVMNALAPDSVAAHYKFLTFLVELGFSFVEANNHGLIYERVRPEEQFE